MCKNVFGDCGISFKRCMFYWLIFIYKYVGYFKMIFIWLKENYMYFFLKVIFYNKNKRMCIFELCILFNYILCIFIKLYLILWLLVYFNKYKNDMYIIL